MSLLYVDRWIVARVFQPILNRIGTDPFRTSQFLALGNFVFQLVAALTSWPLYLAMLAYVWVAVLLVVAYRVTTMAHRRASSFVSIVRIGTLLMWLIEIAICVLVGPYVAPLISCAGLGLYVAGYFFLSCDQPRVRVS